MKPHRVLIIEPFASGHRGVWLRRISSQLFARGWRVLIATLEESTRHPSMSWLAQSSIAVVTPSPAANATAVGTAGAPAGIWPLARAEWANFHLLRSLEGAARARHEFDLVLLPYGDYALHAVGLLGSPFVSKWVSIVMRPTFHHREAGVLAPPPRLARLRRSLFRAYVQTGTQARCLTIDQPLYETLRHDRVVGARLAYLPDPVDAPLPVDGARARARLGIPAAATVVLIYGTLTLLKGAQHLLAALQQLACHDVHLIVAGAQDADFRGMLHSAPAQALRLAGRLHEFSGWLDELNEALVFGAADIVWLGYSGHHQSSGVQVQAGRLGLPTISCDAGLIGWQTRRHASGLTVRVSDSAAVAGAVTALVDSAPLRSALGRNGQRAFADYTWEAGGDVIGQALEEALASVAHAAKPVAARALGKPRVAEIES